MRNAKLVSVNEIAVPQSIYIDIQNGGDELVIKSLI